MRAFVVPAPGESPALVDVAAPDPAPGEARIKVRAASVNGFDLAVAAGWMSGFFEHRYPVVLGREFAGIVDAVGEDVSDLAIGDRVLGVVSKPYLAEGAFAEYTTAVVEDGVVLAPDALSDVEAAGLAHTGSTAIACLQALGDVEGRTVLVVGATGGVGTLFVQLAAAAGARVIATGRTEAGRALLRGLGAEFAIDYARLADEVRAVAPDGVDAAVHLSGDPTEFSPLVRDGGGFASPILYSPDMFADAERLRFAPIAAYPTAHGLTHLTTLASDGRLRVIVDREHEFDAVAHAFAAYGRETVGNIVVVIG